MKKSVTGKRPARRSTPESTAQAAAPPHGVKTVGLDSVAHALMEVHARKLGLSGRQYASAAVTYFAEQGLDPRAATGITEGPLTRQKLSETGQLLLKRDDENTNRLITILRGVERQLYTYQQQSNLAILDYLAKIEAGNLAYLIGVETQVLAPMLELLLRGNIDAHMARMTSSILLHVGQRGEKTEDMPGKHRQYDENRERKLVEELRTLLQKYRVVKPEPAPKPKLPAIPTALPKPAAPGPDYY